MCSAVCAGRNGRCEAQARARSAAGLAQHRASTALIAPRRALQRYLGWGRRSLTPTAFLLSPVLHGQ
eukprot:6190324-Pleurochrysis_carterae.AAC.2